MRTLRLSLAGTLTLALLGGMGGAVMAQMDAEPEAVYFTASGPYTDYALGATSAGNSLYSSRDGFYAFDVEATDPRVSGALTVFYNADVDTDTGHGIQWGTLRIENDGGTWEGPFTGMEYEPPEGDFVAGSSMMVGDGDYAGYTLYLQGDMTQFGPAHDLHGVVFKGQPPAAEAFIEPIKVVAAERDAVAGYIVVPMLRVVSASEVSPDVFTDLAELKGRKAAVDILAGTPITPDLLEPAE
jgi:hypothetical protein